MKYSVDKYQPPQGKLLIKPLRERSRMVENIVLDDEKNKDKDPLKDEMETKKVKERAPYEVQLATVLASGDPEYPVGCTVVYSMKFVKDFDLFKKVYLVSNYDLYGKYEV
jgi:nitrogenase subunit NifH